MTVPIIGMKFKGKYIIYRIRALGANLANGFLINFPSFAIGSDPAFICLPLDTRSVVFFDRRTPSKVSTKASSIKNVLLRIVNKVELSLRTSSAALMAAKGPLQNLLARHNLKPLES